MALKPQMYANLDIKSKIEESGLVIPQEAVIDSGIRKIAFLSKGKGRFEPREIVVGPEVNGNGFQILEGLEKDDKIVISAQFMFDSESRLREAINKLLEARSGQSGEDEEFEDLDFEGMEMDEFEMPAPEPKASEE
jgi:Cu(I)/Ag(I) efflux system membrane fusion protein/cobalt-zinc-cadmium efflux system membrane fusion protein